MRPYRLLMPCLALTLITASLRAEETVPALKAEVQTAQWAVKWWLPRHEQKLAEVKSRADQVDLLFIGDSITHGWEGHGKEVWKKYYEPRKAFNIGFSGDRTEQVIWRLREGEVAGISPKLAIIMIGTNNTGHRQDPAEQTAAGVQAILRELAERLPKTKILLLAIFPRGATTDDKLRVLNTQINARLAKMDDGKRVHFLDINKTFLAEDGTLSKDIMPDLLHPHEKGYGMWAEAMEPKIKALMGE